MDVSSERFGTTDPGEWRRLAARSDGVVHLRDLRATGLTEGCIRGLLRRGELDRYLPQVLRVAGSSPTWQQKVRAVSLWATDKGALSHTTAGLLYELDGCADDLIHVTVVERMKRPATWIRVHQVRELQVTDVTRVRGMRVSQPWRVLLELAALLPPTFVDRALDDLLRRRLISVPRLRHFIDRVGARGRNGTATIRELLAAREGLGLHTESALERHALKVLRAHGLPRPVTQFPITWQGRTFRVDLAYPDARLAIELDGVAYHSSSDRFQQDRWKINALTALGYTQLRFTWRDVNEREAYFAEAVGRFVAPER